MTPVKHAESSVKHYGGVIEDYIEIHNWFDETKALTGNWTHRAMRHHSAGIAWCVEKFGDYFTNSNNRIVPVKVIAEQHVQEDCGFIPTVQDWLAGMLECPQPWMLKVQTKSVKPLEIAE